MLRLQLVMFSIIYTLNKNKQNFLYTKKLTLYFL